MAIRLSGFSRNDSVSQVLPRVQVIDRTMVGMGLISEQELAEIHDIGEKMAQFQSDAAFIAASGRTCSRRIA